MVAVSKIKKPLISKESSKTIGNLQQLPKALLALDAGSTPVAAHFRMWDGPKVKPPVSSINTKHDAPSLVEGVGLKIRWA